VSPNTLDYVIVGGGIVLLASGFLLERKGVFLYLGYTQVGVGSILAIGFLIRGILSIKSQGRAAFYFGLAISFILALSAWGVGSLDSSPRKHFYLLATRIQSGESMDTVRKRMAQYESWQKQEGYESFGFVSGPGTSDVVIVHYDGHTGKVLDADLSLD
jgi:hypothetical protein